MKIRTKVLLQIIIVLIFGVGASTFIAINDMKSKAEKDFQIYREEEFARIKANLKNSVDMAYEVVSNNYQNIQDKEFIIKHYSGRIKDIVFIAETILQKKVKLVKKGSLNLREAKKQALEDIGKIRYENGEGYVWINDTGKPFPSMIMHPILPKLNGSILDDPKYNCATGTFKNLFVEARDVCIQDGGGYIEYIWPKPLPTGGILENAQKLSYVKLFKPWNWIIGTGIYIDNAIVDAKQISKSSIRNMRYDNGTGYLWINNIEEPFPRMIMHPIIPELEDKILDDPKYDCAADTSKNLFVEARDVCIQDGEGYIEYIWSKPLPTGEIVEGVSKISYVRLFKPWNWIIGAGAYTDTIEKNIFLKRKEIETRAVYLIIKILLVAVFVVLFGFILSIFFASNISKPINELIEAMHEVKQKGLKSIQVSLGGTDEIKMLGNIFNEMITAISDGIVKLQKTTAAKEKVESELHIARDIQMGIIPSIFPIVPPRPDIDIYAILKPAKAVGGDLYDFSFTSDGKFYFVIGDVAGKGVPASLFMAITVTLFRSKIGLGLSLEEIVCQMNEALCQNNEMCVFVTLFIGILDLSTGEMTYCNAGHNPSYIIRKNSVIERLEDVHGMPLGISRDKYFSSKCRLQGGDSVFCYTDGVTEAVDKSNVLFGEEKLENILKKVEPRSRILVENIVNSIDEFSFGAEQADDITLLVFKLKD